MSKKQSVVRRYTPGIGEAVANRTINRDIIAPYKRRMSIKVEFMRDDSVTLDDTVAAWCKHEGYIYDSYELVKIKEDKVTVAVKATGRKRKETWEIVSGRVAKGNVLIHGWDEEEYDNLKTHIAQATLLTSGRHLQHGDETQPGRNMEVFTNCSTAASSFVLFYLLLNGSGVGRSYDDDMMVVDWTRMPVVEPVIDHSHPDVQSGEIVALTRSEALHLYKFAETVVFEVPDSREGWAKAIEMIELMAFDKSQDKVLILDFTGVRERGRPIGGMQNRPASGPGPLMGAINKIKTVRGSAMRPWRAAMFVDHYLAECVLVGGARRAARMSTKSWRDRGIFEFIDIKRGGFLWSSNNSVTVDQDFWNQVKNEGQNGYAKRVFEAVTSNAYNDGTGEPGFINQDKLVDKGDKTMYLDGRFITGGKYAPEPAAERLFSAIATAALTNSPYTMITNPCGEIPLLMWGGYCVLADVVPYHATDDDDAEDAFRAAARFLIRVNMMDNLYWREVNRTNRIGVSMTGIHEYALSRFGYTFQDLIDEEKSQPFWQTLSRFKRAVDEEALFYSEKIGVTPPHTTTTIKPAGTTSKLFGLTEGAHLPAMREYIRWVQFRNDDPLLSQYEQLGYPMRKLRTYGGTTVVGFPTQPEICRIAKRPEEITTASEATPEEQYRWIRLLEKYWIRGVDEQGRELQEDTGNQVSYTLKIDTDRVSYPDYRQTVLDHQSQVKCCTIMPVSTSSLQVYEYTPEESVTKERYEMILEEINRNKPDEIEIDEDVDMDTLVCASGACPI